MSTTTTLVVSTGASANDGTAVTLTANVTANSAVPASTVLFCDATAPRCDGAAIFGMAQLNPSGVASYTFFPGVGSYSIKAVYVGIGSDPTSTSSSAVQVLTITPHVLYGSSTKIAATGVPGNYTLTATAAGFGIVPPSGTVTFNDVTASTVLGTSSLAAMPVGRDFGLSYSAPQGNLSWQAAGDFNGDGKVDLVTVNSSYFGSISVLLGGGDGTFNQNPLTISVGQVPNYVQVADINHDGKLDILVTEGVGNDVGVLLGNGDGTFQAEVTYPTGQTPQYFVVADLNGDGILDLVVNNSNDATLSVLLGNGDGTFQPQTTVAVGTSRGFAVGDVNNDGIPDLVVSADDYVNSPPQSSISVFLGNGDGSFHANPLSVALPSGMIPTIPAVADLRRNGTLDVVFGNDSDLVGRAYVLLGNNDGTFAPIASYPTGDSAQSVSVADMNNDGVLDLVVPNTGPDGSGSGVSVLYGMGDGTFGAFTQYQQSNVSGPSVAVIADFNGDGLMDIATANLFDGSTAVLLQLLTTPATLTGVSVPGPGTNSVNAVYGGDTSHSSSQSGVVPLHPLPSTMTFAGSPNPTTAGTPVTLTAFLSGTGGVPTGSVSFYRGTTLLGTGTINGSGTATYPLGAGLNARTGFSAVYAGDAVYAGSTAALLEYVGTPTSVALGISAPSVAAGTQVTLTATVTPNPAVQSLAAGQIVFNYQQTVNGTTRTGTFGPVALNTLGVGTTKIIAGAGTYAITASFSGTAAETPSTSAAQTIIVAASPLYSSVTTLTPTTVAPNDYHLLASVTASGQAPPSGPVSFYSDGSTLLGTVALDPTTLTDSLATAPGSPFPNAAGSPTFVATGDLNGDGVPDLVTAVSGNAYSVAVQLGVGDGSLGAPSHLHLSYHPNSIAIADLNGDGVPDLIVPESTGVGILLGTGNGHFAPESFVNAGAGSALYVVATDLDGDGIVDLAIAGSSGPIVMLGVGDGTFHAPVAYAAAAGGAGLAVADLNSDGVPDLIAANAGNGSVSLFLGKGDGTFQQPSTKYLAANHPLFVTTADLRHNGIKDVIVTDEQGANVYVMLGNNNGTLQNAVAYPVPSSGYHSGAGQVLAADLNNDGILDLAVADYGSYGNGATVSVLPGIGDGTFGTRADYPSGTGPYSLAIADFNSDGLLDLATADMAGATSTIYLQQQTVNAAITNISLDGAGNHPVLASYAGDATRTASQSTATVLTGLNQAATTTVVTFSPSPVSAGQTLNLIATVTPTPTGTSLGTVAFYSGATLLGTGNVNGQGRATFAIMNVAAGSLTVHAVYSGNPTSVGSTSAPVPITVTAATRLALSGLPSTIVTGGNLGTVNVSIEDVSGSIVTTSTAPVLLTITGAAGYSLTANALAVGGTATFSLSSTPITVLGIYTVSATSPGLTSASANVTVTSGVAAQLATSAPPATLVSGGNVGTLTATIKDASGNTVTSSSAPVTTMITGPNGYSQSVTVAAVNGVATLNLSSLGLTTAGTYTVTTSSPGLTSVTVSVIVTPGTAAQITASAAPSPLVRGGNLGSITGTLKDANGNTLTNSSLPVTAMITGPSSYSQAVTVPAANGQVVFNLSSLPLPNAGTYTLTITGAGLTPVTQTIVVAKSTPTIVWVTPAAIGYGTPLSATQLNATASVAGTLTYNPAAGTMLPAGTNSLSVTFTPNDVSNYTTATGTVHLLVQAPSTTSLITSSSTQLASMPLTFTAQVNSGFAGTLTGSVSFFDGSTLLGTSALNANEVATYTTTSLGDGSHTITATYSGDANYLASTSTSTAATVMVADVNLNLGGDQNKSVVPGAAVAYNFPLSPLVTPTFLYDVHLTATGLPSGATYTFTPAVIPAGSGSTPVTLTVQTAKGVASLSAPATPGSKNSSRGLTALAFGMFLPLLGAGSVRKRLKSLPRPLAVVLFTLVSLAAAAGLSGCGAGGFFGTTASSGHYTITVTATSGSLVRTSTVQLTIQ